MKKVLNFILTRFTNFKNRPSWAIDFILFFCIVIFALFISDPLLRVIGIDFRNYTFKRMQTTQIISAFVLAPIIEEIIFRTHLSFKQSHHFGVLLFTIACSLQFRHQGWFYLSIFGVIFLLISFLYEKSHVIISIKHPRITFWFTSVVFCFFHFPYLSEYDLNLLTKVGLLLLGYLPLSLYLGYLRKSQGLIFSIMAHSFFNFFSVIGNSLYY
tara:strand:- start:2064 stop:2702 length:639 start_codon:yes stop_codon:yes gene_type:complete